MRHAFFFIALALAGCASPQNAAPVTAGLNRHWDDLEEGLHSIRRELETIKENEE